MAIKNASFYLWCGLSGAAAMVADPVGRGTCAMSMEASTADCRADYAAKAPFSIKFTTKIANGDTPLPISSVKNVTGFCEMEFTPHISRESIIDGAGTCQMRFRGTVQICGTDIGPSVRDAVNAVLRVWGTTCDVAQGGELDEALQCVNSAIQRLHQSGREFGFTSEEIHLLQLGDMSEMSVQTLNDEVQTFVDIDRVTVIEEGVDGGVVGTYHPRPVKSILELDRIQTSYRSVGTFGSLVRIPVAYYVEQAPTAFGGGITEGAMPRNIRVHFAPWAYAELPYVMSIAMRVIKRAPRYSRCDLPARINVPHEYVETLVIPLAKFYALSSKYFRRKEIAEAIVAQASQVRALIGESDPAPKIVQNRK